MLGGVIRFPEGYSIQILMEPVVEKLNGGELGCITMEPARSVMINVETVEAVALSGFEL